MGICVCSRMNRVTPSAPASDLRERRKLALKEHLIQLNQVDKVPVLRIFTSKLYQVRQKSKKETPSAETFGSGLGNSSESL